jgi:Domain of unknown function (DUF4157)
MSKDDGKTRAPRTPAPKAPSRDLAPREAVNAPDVAQESARESSGVAPGPALLAAFTDPGSGELSRSRAQAGHALQRRIGNQGYLRTLSRNTAPGSSSEAVPDSVASHVDRTRGQGQPLDGATRSDMENHFSRDLSGVRVHTGENDARAARNAGAQAFATGRDIYFAADRYQPQTNAGRRLLAHELAHTVQNGTAPPVRKAKEGMSSPDDPEERAAERAADRVSQGLNADVADGPASGASSTGRLLLEEETAPARGSETRPTPAPSRAPVPAAPPAPEGSTEVAAGDGGLLVKLGAGIAFAASELSGRREKLTLDLREKPATVPGLALKAFHYWPREKKGEVKADLAVPFLPNLRGGIQVSVDKDGLTKLETKLAPKLSLGALRDPVLELRIDEQNQIGGSVAITADQMKVPGVPKLKVSGGGEVVLERGELSGSVNANLDYEGFAQGAFNLGFKEGVPEGGGKVDITHPVLAGASATLTVVGGDITAEATVPVDKLVPSLPGVEITAGTLTLASKNGDVSGSLSGLTVKYKSFGEGVLSGSISKGQVSADGSFALQVPAMESVKGTFGFRRGAMFGSLTVSAKDFPKSLPVKSGTIKGAINEAGKASFSGEVGVEFAGVGRGTLRGNYDENGVLNLGADVALAVPGLQGVTGTINYVNGEFEGSISVPIESEKLAGLKGNLLVEYKNKLWRGESKFLYERDDGKLKGEVTLGLAQKDTGKLAVYGGGTVTAQLTSFLRGTLGVDILEDGTTTIKGAITVTEPIPLFPEKKMDRELFRVSQNIPLWAILVAVIRARGGVRAGIGPGVLRNITVAGEYTVGEDDPSFSITGELFIPAYVEAYVAIGAGLGLDVVLGSLTGGIELVGTAGIYGAVSVIPVISYENGEYSIDGTATLAAGAKVKLGIQAWAEIEALWITIWEETWALGEWIWDVGPTLALQANMHYTFGRPEAPTLDFKTDNIDAEKLVQDAMPKDGPGGSGARDALKNRAEWSGRNKGKGDSADSGAAEAVPSDSAAPALAAPAKPSKKPKPADGAVPAGGAVKEEGGKVTPALKKTIDDAAKKKADEDAAKGAPAAVPVPSFPAPTKDEIELGWANYLEETKGKVAVKEVEFANKMAAGEVYHPKFKHWSTLAADYTKAYGTLTEEQKGAAFFAAKMRGGFVPGSILVDSSYDLMAIHPAPNGKSIPYPIHFPTQFLLSGFENFKVDGGLILGPAGHKAYDFEVGEDSTVQYSFGVAPSWSNMMNIDSVLQRKAADRGSPTQTMWRRWRAVGFAGGAASGVGAPKVPVLAGGTRDDSMFRNSRRPDGTPLTQTFGQFISSDSDFSSYQALRGVDQNRFRAAARKARFNIDDKTHVDTWAKYLSDRAEFEASDAGVLGYEQQHVVPLFLAGTGADVVENLWPLSFAAHREGHAILKNQPQLEQWGESTSNIEDPAFIGKKFIIKAHGNTL